MSYEIGPRRWVRIKYWISPDAIAEVLEYPLKTEYGVDRNFAKVREDYDGDELIYEALDSECTVIPVITAHSTGGRWIWYAKVCGLLSDGPHASIDPGYETKIEALMAGLEKYPDGIIDDRRRL